MGAVAAACCGARDNTPKQANKEGRDAWGFLEGGASKNDAELFDDAYKAQSVEGFVALIDSTTPIKEPEQKLHPWAATPTCIGSLAVSQIAIMVANEDNERDDIRESSDTRKWDDWVSKKHIRDIVREKGGVEKLVKLLWAPEKDRCHAAIVAFAFLAADDDMICKEMYDKGAMDRMVFHMRTTSIEGERAACAQSCRNMFFLGTTQRDHFLELGGVSLLVESLDYDPATAIPADSIECEEVFITQFEACCHLEDLIVHEGQELTNLIEAVVEAGALPRLRKLQTIPHEPMQEVIEKLLRYLERE